jgi:antiviral helicase SKI2
MLGQQSIAPKARRRRREGRESPELQISRLGDEDQTGDAEGGEDQAGPSRKNVDDLLPIGVSVMCRIRISLTSSDCPLRLHQGNSSRRLPGRNGHTSWMSTRRFSM